MSGMCYYPLAATRQRELYPAQQEREGRRKGRGKGNLSCRNESLASSFAFVAFPPTHACEGEGGFVVAFLLSFVESRRLNLPPRCQKKIGRGGIMASRQSCQSVEAAGAFSLSSSPWPRTFARMTIACRQTTTAAAAAFQFNPPSSGFFFLSRSRKEICQAVCPVFPPSFALPLVTWPCEKV